MNKVILQINSGILTRRLPIDERILERILRGDRFAVPVKKVKNLSIVKELSMTETTGIPMMEFVFHGKREGSDGCPILEFSDFKV